MIISGAKPLGERLIENLTMDGPVLTPQERELNIMYPLMWKCKTLSKKYSCQKAEPKSEQASRPSCQLRGDSGNRETGDGTTGAPAKSRKWKTLRQSNQCFQQRITRKKDGKKPID